MCSILYSKVCTSTWKDLLCGYLEGWLASMAVIKGLADDETKSELHVCNLVLEGLVVWEKCLQREEPRYVGVSVTVPDRNILHILLNQTLCIQVDREMRVFISGNVFVHAFFVLNDIFLSLQIFHAAPQLLKRISSSILAPSLASFPGLCLKWSYHSTRPLHSLIPRLPQSGTQICTCRESLVSFPMWAWHPRKRTKVFRKARFSCRSTNYMFNARCVWYSSPIARYM